jgi:PAS domain S-box-containing protein
MNFFEKTSVKIRFLYLIMVIALFTVVSALTFLHTIHSVTELDALKKKTDSYFTDIHRIDHLLLLLGPVLADSPQQAAAIHQEIRNNTDAFSTKLEQLKAEPLVRDTDEIIQQVDVLAAGVTMLKNRVEALYVAGANQGPGLDVAGLHDNFIDPLLEARSDLSDMIYQASFLRQKKYAGNLVFILFTCFIVLILVVSLTEISNYLNIRQILNFARDLDRGDRRAKIYLASGSEFIEISRLFNSYLEKQMDKIRFLRTIGEGGDQSKYEPESADILGNEIIIMAERLQRSREEETRRQEEDYRRNWTSRGIAQFSELLRSERDNVRELANQVIQQLVTYLQIEMGTLFLTVKGEEGEQRLETVAAYAYDRRKYISKTFLFGEGLPGTCALEGEKIYMNDIPESFSEIISGMGQTLPRHALLVPLRIRDDIFGVLELASFRALEKHELDFVDQIADSIASGLEAVKNNERTAALLQQSREQAGQLRRQEEALRINLQKLENAQQESLKKESEINGMLDAINKSALVAEFSLNGRFTQVNDKFLELMEAPADMVLGKHHSQFAVIGQYADDYKKFWEKLKSGESVTRVELFRLSSGKEIWLRQHCTPLRNSAGIVSRILNIASDITAEKRQQEMMGLQSAEIEKHTAELEGMKAAMEHAFLYCELDQDGIITGSNRKFADIAALSGKEHIGRNIRLFLPDEERGRFEQKWNEVLQGIKQEGNMTWSTPSGKKISLSTIFSPVSVGEGRTSKVYFISRDVSETTNLQLELEKVRNELNRLKRAP